MDIRSEQYMQIAYALARHYECVYYVDVNTGHYKVFIDRHMDEYPSGGDDFFADLHMNAAKLLHPEDFELMEKHYTKEQVLAALADNKNYSFSFRILVKGVTTHMRHVVSRCDDGEHILCCLENTEEEIVRHEQQLKELREAKRMARLDELTGVRNNNAFREYAAIINSKIRSRGPDYEVGIVMCDLNDLKLINDTRGHSYGDETIQSTSRMICDIFEHSHVFRVGGDEFVVVLRDRDYGLREYLLKDLRDKSYSNRVSRSGPVVACGMAVYEYGRDENIESVYARADAAMYEDKHLSKSAHIKDSFNKLGKIDTPIPEGRKRLLDSLFGALLTISDGGYVFLNDMRYDFSRWALALVDDFGIESEYMYHADKVWEPHIHPDDLKAYKDAVGAILTGDLKLRHMYYRARKPDGTYVRVSTRGFVMSDKYGDPEYFGGIIVPAVSDHIDNIE
ncbi:MAG: diguanylate cyclase [Saccharofermentans sp.]|nr:diguanylate cyclase [Saccharofermentans sp.]